MEPKMNFHQSRPDRPVPGQRVGQEPERVNIVTDESKSAHRFDSLPDPNVAIPQGKFEGLAGVGQQTDTSEVEGLAKDFYKAVGSKDMAGKSMLVARGQSLGAFKFVDTNKKFIPTKQPVVIDGKQTFKEVASAWLHIATIQSGMRTFIYFVNTQDIQRDGNGHPILDPVTGRPKMGQTLYIEEMGASGLERIKDDNLWLDLQALVHDKRYNHIFKSQPMEEVFSVPHSEAYFGRTTTGGGSSRRGGKQRTM